MNSDSPKISSFLLPTNPKICESGSDKYGIITAHLTDPFSKLINKMFNTNESEPNSIGFYFESDLKLFSTYHAHPIYWMSSCQTLPDLLSSPFATNIISYSLDMIAIKNYQINKDKKFPSVYESFQTKPLFNSVNVKRHFSQMIYDIISKSEQNSDDIYTSILLRYANLEFKTGYYFVNKVLSRLLQIPEPDRSTSILPPFVLKPQLLQSTFPSNNLSLKHILNLSHVEITNLTLCFTNLFIKHEQFRSSILSNISPNFLNEFVPNIVQLIESGINNTPSQLSKSSELSELSRSSELSESKGDNIRALKDLGCRLTDIITANEKFMTVDLRALIDDYNKAIDNTNLSKIDIPKYEVSKPAILILNHYKSEIQDVSIIPMNSHDLSSLTTSQLSDILIYIDSLRDSDGNTDLRFATLQNNIVYHLSLK